MDVCVHNTRGAYNFVQDSVCYFEYFRVTTYSANKLLRDLPLIVFLFYFIYQGVMCNVKSIVILFIYIK